MAASWSPNFFSKPARTWSGGVDAAMAASWSPNFFSKPARTWSGGVDAANRVVADGVLLFGV